MPIPANIISEVAALNTAIVSASPLENATQATMAALALEADGVVNDTETALLGYAGALDTFVPAIMPPAIVLQVLALEDASETQWQLATLGGYVGRLATNLTNG